MAQFKLRLMKSTLRISLLIIALFLGISCNNNPNSNQQRIESSSDSQKSVNSSEEGGYLSCKMDGILIKADYPGIAVLYVPAKKEVNIWGKTPSGIISITIDNVESTGTFIIKGNSKNGAGIMSGPMMYEVKKSGTPFEVKIESIETIKAINSPDAKAIRGTFHGKLQDLNGKTVEITEGKFSTQ